MNGALWEERARRLLDRPLLQLGTAAALFAVVALVSTSQLWVNWNAAGAEASWWALFGVRLIDWGLWAVAVPGVVALDGFLRGRSRPWTAMVAAHAVAATAWFGFENTIAILMAPVVDPTAVDRSFWDAYLVRGAVRLTTAWIVYAGILATIAFLRDFVRRQRLARDLWDAQLRALRAQIQPHFLFNTLHTVGALVRTGERDEAIGTLVALSELLRRSLGLARQDTVPLEEELGFLDSYLAIQHARFGERLHVTTTVAPEARGAEVPPLLLQPLVENAIRHGLDLDRGPGTVWIAVAVEGSWLHVSVEDDGGAPDDGVNGGEGVSGNGIGLSNLRDRLSRLYGHDQSLELAPNGGGGTAVTIRIPRRSPTRP